MHSRQLVLEFFVEGSIPRDIARSTAPGAKVLDRIAGKRGQEKFLVAHSNFWENFSQTLQKGFTLLHDGFLDFGVRAHAQIVIAAPHGYRPLRLGKVLRIRRLPGKACHLLEDPIRVILFFALDLVAEELFIFESWRVKKRKKWVVRMPEYRPEEECDEETAAAAYAPVSFRKTSKRKVSSPLLPTMLCCCSPSMSSSRMSCPMAVIETFWASKNGQWSSFSIWLLVMVSKTEEVAQ